MSGPRAKGSGGVFAIRPGVWRVDIELPRDKVTGKRRRVSRYIEGARSVAEVELSRLRVADNEKRLPTGGTSARSVRAALDLAHYVASVAGPRPSEIGAPPLAEVSQNARRPTVNRVPPTAGSVPLLSGVDGQAAPSGQEGPSKV